MENYKPPFTINNEMLSLVSLIMEKVGKIDAYGNLSKYPFLRKQNRIKSIHSSCAIEANSLSLDQVNDVINGVNVLGPLKDILEVKNAIEAYDKIEDVNPLKESNLKSIHYIFGKNVVLNPGQYRNGDEGVTDENGNVIFIAPRPEYVPSLMANLFAWIKSEYKNISPLILSSVFHYEFVFIHPFTDGNGRTARYWQNALLGKWRPIFYWLPLENLIHQYQDDYYQAISKSHLDGNSDAFIVFMLKMINQTLDGLMNDTDAINHATSIYIDKLLNALRKNVWYTANEILTLLSIKSKESLRKNYLDPAIKSGLMKMEYPDKPTSRNQRYKIIK